MDAIGLGRKVSLLAELHALAVGASFQTGLGHHHGGGLVLDGLLQQEDVLLQVEELLLHLVEVQLDLVLGLGHFLGTAVQGVVGVAPVVPHGAGNGVDRGLRVTAQLRQLRPFRLRATHTLAACLRPGSLGADTGVELLDAAIVGDPAAVVVELVADGVDAQRRLLVGDILLQQMLGSAAVVGLPGDLRSKDETTLGERRTRLAAKQFTFS